MTKLRQAGDYQMPVVDRGVRPGTILRIILLAIVLTASAAAFVVFKDQLENEIVLGILGVLAMQRQKAEARANWAGSGEAATETIWFELRDKHGATDFLGYDTESAEGVIQAIVRDGAVVESATKGENVQLVLNQTPFYGESGGQVGDTGVITTETGKLAVTDTQKRGEGLFVHYCTVVEGSVKTGDAAALTVDHADFSGKRIVAFPDLGKETAPGDANAPDAGDLARAAAE